jgi:UDP-N-acetylenolpyruvoylglucosamine reductase
MQILKNHDLTTLNTLGLSSQAENFVEITSVENLKTLLADKNLKSAPWNVLGGGSNLVLAPSIAGLVLKVSNLGRELIGADADNYFVKIQSGEVWHEAVQWTLSHGYNGLENLSLIPGTTGAAPIQNIGAYGIEVKDILHSVTALELSTGEMKTFTNAECHFAYRDSFFKQEGAGKYLIWDVTFRLLKKEKLQLSYGDIQKELDRQGLSPSAKNISQAVISLRQSKLPDPKVIGNAGSFFKNPIVSTQKRNELLSQHPDIVSYAHGDGYKLAAGWLIERAGWKGKRLGPVGMYEKQALVLVNHGGANALDVWKLASAVNSDVQQRFGVILEAEPVRW